MNPFDSLSSENHDQILKYLRFFRQKKDGILRDIASEIGDIRSDRLEEDMFTKDDMMEFSDFMSSAVQAHVTADLSAIISMGALAVNQLLSKSQENGIELSLETAPLENQALLDAIDKMNLDAVSKNIRRGGTLTSFRDESKAMREQTERLEDKNARLQAEVDSLRRRLGMADQSLSDAAESKMQGDAETRMNMRSMESALNDAKEENNKRVNDTAQFQQMKKIMQSQSATIRDLRRRLERYEPDSAKQDDEG